MQGNEVRVAPTIEIFLVQLRKLGFELAQLILHEEQVAHRQIVELPEDSKYAVAAHEAGQRRVPAHPELLPYCVSLDSVELLLCISRGGELVSVAHDGIHWHGTAGLCYLPSLALTGFTC